MRLAAGARPASLADKVSRRSVGPTPRPRVWTSNRSSSALRRCPVRWCRICPDGVDVRKLPADCTETANTPEVLFEKLDPIDAIARLMSREMKAEKVG